MQYVQVGKILAAFSQLIGDPLAFSNTRCHEPDKLDDTIKEMIALKHPVIVDVIVDQKENCFPMIPSGAAHNDMLLGPDDKAGKLSDEGLALV